VSDTGSERSAGFGTRALRAATRVPPVDQQPDAVPIYQSLTFSSQSAAELVEVLADRRPGYSYSRIDNPTSSALADALAEIEGAEAGYCFASGMAAVHAAFVSVLRSGDHVVAARQVYGSVQHLLDKVMPRFGIETTFVDATDPDAIEVAFTSRTRLLHVETIANPTIVVADLADLVERAHRRGILVSVDNTFASPWLCRPIELGADFVIEALSKWIGGHSDVLAGAVVGSRERISEVRAVQIDTGGSLAPLSAFLVLRGIETLHVRMERTSSTALTLARALEAAGVQPVYYPGLPSHPQSAVAQRQLHAGGGMLAFELADRATAESMLDALTLLPRTASLGGVRTMAVNPASTTHRQLDAATLAKIGISQGLVRVSVGLEDPDDLVADFEQALAVARSAAGARPAPAATIA
jgi:cystathionine beta-lyase/cystathionine gamma-synthase